MSARTLSITLVAAVALILASAAHLFALPTQIVHNDTPQCDTLFIPTLVDEIGDPGGGFPPDEQLAHSDQGLANSVCTATDLPAIPDALVSITNLTGRDLTEVWYVADAETTITNFDGEANDSSFSPLQEAFRIDRIGNHQPLISEDATQDGIWEAGETWEFVLQDYTNTKFLPPDAITSPGVGDASADVLGFVASSGSIIAIPSIPEPGSAALALLGMTVFGLIPRRKRAVHNVTD